MKKRISVILLVFILTSCTAYRMPMQGVEGMSGDTLCYRAAYAQDDPSVTAEIRARNLDCAQILEEQGSNTEF